MSVLNDNRKGIVLWFTGLPSSGKSTLAHAVENILRTSGYKTCVLDGDTLRRGLCEDLGYSEKDRKENIRRAGEVARILFETGIIVLAAFISPFSADRSRLRNMFPEGAFFEVYCKCPLKICELRDTRGQYRRARNGEIKEFTGISSPYEEPETADLVLATDTDDQKKSVYNIVDMLVKQSILTRVL